MIRKNSKKYLFCDSLFSNSTRFVLWFKHSQPSLKQNFQHFFPHLLLNQFLWYSMLFAQKSDQRRGYPLWSFFKRRAHHKNWLRSSQKNKTHGRKPIYLTVFTNCPCAQSLFKNLVNCKNSLIPFFLGIKFPATFWKKNGLRHQSRPGGATLQIKSLFGTSVGVILLSILWSFGVS